MKKSMLVAGLFEAVVALVLVAPAIAQQNAYIINVPFRFHVSAHELPAGKYRIGMVAPGIVQVRGVDHIVNAMFAAPQVGRSSHGSLIGELVFHRYGQKYFLSRVWFQDVDAGYELNISNTEREVAQQTASTETALRAAK
jgi:hypothetical protein